MDSIKILGTIGEGSFGVVKKIIITKDFDSSKHSFRKDEVYGMKKLMNRDLEEEDSGISQDVLKETCLLNILDHPNILQSLANVTIDGCKHIRTILPLAKCSLLNLIDSHQEISLDIIYQIVCGLAYMHSMGIMHEDVKPGNVLYFDDGTVKIADFGMSSFVNGRKSIGSSSQTWVHQAPEDSWEHSYESDAWALGTTIYMCGYGTRFYSDFMVPGFTGPPVKTEYFVKYPKLFDLVVRLLEVDPVKRVSVRDALKFPVWDSIKRKCSTQIPLLRFDIDPKIDYESRKLAIEWLIKACDDIKHSQSVKCLAIDIFDRYLSIKHIDSDYLLPSVCVAIHISSSLLGGCVWFGHWTTTFPDIINKDMFFNTLCDIVQTLEWKLYRPTLDTIITDPKMLSRLDHCLARHQTPDEIIL